MNVNVNGSWQKSAGGRLRLYLRGFGGQADVAPAGEVPGVGEVPALLGFHRLDPTILPMQKDAGSVRLIDEGESAPVGAEAGVALDEIILG